MTTQTTLDAIRQHIHNPSIKVVSFDIFDTLLCRYVAFPRDLLEIYDDDFNDILQGFPLLSFAKERFQTEDRFRQQILESEPWREEINLDEIYRHLGDQLALPDDVLERLKAREIELERRHLQPRRSAVSLLEEARAVGKRVAIVSDMYLSGERLASILADKGITDYDGLFVSCDLDKKKRTGSLFWHVLEEYQIAPHEMLHIGDNHAVDIAPARKLGIHAVYFPKALDAFLALDGNRAFLGGRLPQADLGYRTVVGFLANRLFDDPFRPVEKNSFVNGDAWWLGYTIYGPLMLFLAKWILEQSLLDGYDEICFMARDGWVLQDIYAQLTPFYEGAPKTHYVYSSRNVFLPWATQRDTHISLTHHYVGVHCGYITFRKLLEERFHIEVTDEVESILAKHGFSDLDQTIGDRYAEFLRAARDPRLRIVETNIEKVKLAQDYYRQFFSPEKRQICFDIGWRGTSQLFLSELLGYPVDSFYLACKSLAFANQYRYGFRVQPYAHYISDFFLSLSDLQLLIENVFGDPTSSTCVGFERKGDVVEPVLSGNPMPQSSQDVILRIQGGVRDFVQEFIAWIQGDVRRLNAIPRHLFDPLLATAQHPYPADVDAVREAASENILMVGKHLKLDDTWKPRFTLHSTQPGVPELDPQQALKQLLRTSVRSMKILVADKYPRLSRSALMPTYRATRSAVKAVLRAANPPRDEP